MTRLRPARFVLAALLAAVVAWPALPTAAAQPLVEREHLEFSFTMDCGGGVVLTEEVTEDLRFTTFVDQDGTPIRFTVFVNFVGVVTNPANGQSVEDLAHFTGIVNLVAGIDVTVGLIYRSTVPGVGVVDHDAGTVTRTLDGDVLFVAGPHDVYVGAGGDPTPRFCAALGA